jgi:hypothetical protein
LLLTVETREDLGDQDLTGVGQLHGDEPTIACAATGSMFGGAFMYCS